MAPWSSLQCQLSCPVALKACPTMTPKRFTHSSENTLNVASHFTQAPALQPHASLSPLPGSLSPCPHLWKSYQFLKVHLRDHGLRGIPSDSPDPNPMQFYFLWGLTANVLGLEEEHFVWYFMWNTASLYLPAPSLCASPVFAILDFSYLLVWTLSKVCCVPYMSRYSINIYWAKLNFKILCESIRF